MNWDGINRRTGFEAQVLSAIVAIKGEIRLLAGKQEDHDYQSQEFRKCLNHKVEQIMSDAEKIKTRLDAVERWTGTGSKILKCIFAIMSGSVVVACGSWLKAKLRL